ncbi:AbrB/MazE/SpoVT family DNA-binding domain-containing protein [Halobellus salinus]|nr:AbrB/MazE/SpoVT family DNA-binding domain-containing protein [Halobellus salinus]SMP18190.1 looped-hinge helix DNA binding domain-containing protein, AbrB family [Halobellus salinus]
MWKPTRISEHGRVTIPKEFRDTYDISAGDEIVWMDTDDGILATKRTHTGGRGMLVPDDATETEREAVAAELKQRLDRRRDSNYKDG